MLSNNEYIKLSLNFESGKGFRSRLPRKLIKSSIDQYNDYVEHGLTVMTIEVLKTYQIYTELPENAELIGNTIHTLRQSVYNEGEVIRGIKVYLMGLHLRGIHCVMYAGGNELEVVYGTDVECTNLAYSSTDSVKDITTNYNLLSLNTRVYEYLARFQNKTDELRIGDVDSTYCARTYLKECYPECVTLLYTAGKEVTLYDVPDLGLAIPDKEMAKVRKSKVSSAVRELIDDSFDYEFLDMMEESAKKFDLHGEVLDGYFFYDYRGRMYWSGNVNPQGEEKNRELTLNGLPTVKYDATCSGIQLGSLLSNNIEMMIKTNVISSGKNVKQDAYQYIADKACELGGLEVGTIPRTVAKKSVMLLPYGAATSTLLGHAKTQAKEHGFEDYNTIGKLVYDACKLYINRDATYNKVMDLVEVSDFVKDGITYGQYTSWTTPDGLNVRSYSKIPLQEIEKYVSRGIDLLYKRSDRRLHITTNAGNKDIVVKCVDGINIKSYRRGIPNVGQLVPNFVHSLDATALRYVCKKLLSEGIDVFPIHDCVIVPEYVDQDKISSVFQEAYQMIADHYMIDVKVDGMVVFPE